ncbi:MAG: metal ABC transporter permease [Gemmatimonadota bacterium]|nr:metal ABC transporter permease [Gemmatimonadota bacterium]
MSGVELEVQLTAVVVAVACALPGVFLVLRRMALLSDAISHTVLLGIVLAFFVVEDLSSPVLVLGAATVGVLTVVLVQAVQDTGLVREDAAIGLVFPALFSVAVILISRFAGDVHLDTDAVLLGELALAPFRRFAPGGVDLGPRSLWVMLGILALNVLFLVAFYKELKLVTFDAELAAALGFSPLVLHYSFMGVVSLTAVGAFDAVGSVLVVAFMVAPPAAAYLLSDRLPRVLLWSAAIAAHGAVAGYWLARWLDGSIAGAMAAMVGVDFLLAFLFAPERGVVAQARRRASQRTEFAATMLAIHLLHHEGGPDADRECRVGHLPEHLRWSPERARFVVGAAARDGLVRVEAGDRLALTEAGRLRARGAMTA